MTPAPALVIVSFGSSEMVERSLPTDITDEFSVVLVDNFSTDAERDRARTASERRGWRFIARPNDGFGAGVNAGCRLALANGATECVLLNPDAHASLEALQVLAQFVRDHPDTLVSPTILTGHGRVWRGSVLDLQTGALRSGAVPVADGEDGRVVGWLSGACLAFSAQTFDRLGGFDESMFMYWEDVDFCWRAQRAGCSLRVLDVTIEHEGGGTQASSPASARKSDLYYYWNTRNRLAFAAQHLSASMVRSWLRSTPAQSLAIWMRGGRRQLLEHPGGAWAAARGTWQGLRTAVPAARHADEGRPTTLQRVLVVHPSPDLYGSDRVMLESVTAFVQAGADVTVALPRDGALVPLLRERGASVEFCPTPILRKAALRPAGMLELGAELLASIEPATALVRRVDPDVIYVSTVTIPGWIVLGRLLRRRVVCHVHEAEASQPAAVRKLLYAPLLSAHQLIVNSRFALDVMTDAWPALAARASIVHNAVPGPDTPSPLPPRPESPRLLFVGRLSPRKGPQVAVEALAQLVEAGVDARLDLLGAVFEGYEWFERDLRDLVLQRGLSQRVQFLGFRSPIWDTLSSTDVVLVPSTIDEPFGNTAVEAMLACRPLVVSDTSGLKEAAGGYANARFVQPEDAASLAHGVVSLLQDWASVQAAMPHDRALAVERHSPRTYRQSLVAQLVR